MNFFTERNIPSLRSPTVFIIWLSAISLSLSLSLSLYRGPSSDRRRTAKIENLKKKQNEKFEKRFQSTWWRRMLSFDTTYIHIYGYREVNNIYMAGQVADWLRCFVSLSLSLSRSLFWSKTHRKNRKFKKKTKKNEKPFLSVNLVEEGCPYSIG